MLSVWPKQPRLKLPRTWSYDGKTDRLAPGPLPLVRLARPRAAAGGALRASARRQQLRRSLTRPVRSSRLPASYTALAERPRRRDIVRAGNRRGDRRWQAGRTVGSGWRLRARPCSRSRCFAGTALAAAPSATTGPTTAVGSTDGDRDRHRRSGRSGDDVGRRVRDLDVVRVEDHRQERGLRHGRGRRLRRADRASSRARPTTIASSRSNGAGTSHGTDAVFTTTVPPDVTTGAASGDHRVRGDAERDRRPEQPRHHLLLRVRDVDELRDEDDGEERRLGDERAVRIGRRLRSADRPRLPLPHRRLERRRHDAPARTRRSRRARRPTVVTADATSVTPTSATLRRLGDTERPLDHTLVRVRHDDGLRHEDVVGERRLGHRAPSSVSSTVKNLKARDDLSLPAGRAELEREDVRRRQDVLDRRCTVGADRRGAGRRVPTPAL